MRKIEVSLSPMESDAVKDALLELGVEEVLVTKVEGGEGTSAVDGVFRGHRYMLKVQKVKIEIMAPQLSVEPIVRAIRERTWASALEPVGIYVSAMGELFQIGARR